MMVIRKSSIVFRISRDDGDRLMKPVNGNGGWQTYLRKVQKCLVPMSDGSWLVTLTDALCEQSFHYGQEKYEDGGFQRRIRPMLPHIAAELGRRVGERDAMTPAEMRETARTIRAVADWWESWAAMCERCGSDQSG